MDVPDSTREKLFNYKWTSRIPRIPTVLFDDQFAEKNMILRYMDGLAD